MKKLISTLLVIVSILSFSLNVSAADTSALVVGDVTAQVGTSVVVPINIADNVGICGATISVYYDDNLLLTDIEAGNAFSSLAMTKPGKFTDNPVRILWDGVDADHSNGVIAKLVFKAPQEPGIYAVNIKCDASDVLDENLSPVRMTVTNGSVRVGNSSDHIWDKGIVTEVATCTTPGMKTYTCTVCKETKTEIIVATGHKFTQYIYNNDAQIGIDGTETAVCDNGCGKKDKRVKKGTALPSESIVRFTDVPSNAYYLNAVEWAVSNDITGGTSATTFGSKQNCTRAQVMTFLWKANGSPEPKSTGNPFTDIRSSNYYYKAVLWAVENGITEGATATTFSPGKECTREQVVSFLWKAAGEPEPGIESNPFSDVSSKKYYYKPVMWAVQKGIASGATSTTFGVGKVCIRAQVMAFLYNVYKENAVSVFVYNDHKYAIYNNGKTWTEAKEACENMGGHLVTIASEEENERIIEQIKTIKKKNNYWLGGYQEGPHWKWVTGEPFEYTKWAPEQPDNDSETCLMLYTYENPIAKGDQTYLWNDLINEGTFGEETWFGLHNFGFICEWDSFQR